MLKLIVRRDLARVLGLKIDETILNGTGTAPEPEGILNTTGIGNVAMGTNGGAPTYGKLIDLIKEVAIDGQTKTVCSSSTRRLKRSCVKPQRCRLLIQ